MKKLCAYFLAAVMLFGLIVPVQPAKAADLKTAEALNLTPTVDGDISEWENDTQYELSERVVDGEAATTGWFKIRWDGSAIYVAGQITDATKEDYNDQIKFLFSFDGVPTGETALDFSYVPKGGVYSWTPVGYNPNGNSLNMGNWNPENAYGNAQNAGTAIMGDGVNYSLFYANYNDGVYTFESSWYPTDELKAFLTAGREIGFDLRWNDFNNGTSPSDSKLTTIGWASDEIDWNSDLRKIGQVTLKGEEVAESAAAVAVEGTPTVDGNIADWSALENKYELNQRVVDGTADTTGYFQVMWDADYLYMAGEIYDATNESGNDLLKVLFDMDGVPTGDMVVTFADRQNAGVHTTSSLGYNPNGGATAWNPLNAWNGYLNPGNTVVAGYDSYVSYDAGKYVFEIKWYPTDVMKTKLTSGASIGLDVQWSDYNNGNYADDPVITTIGWSSELVDWNNDLRTMGELTLAAMPAQMKGWNIALGDNIGVNFFVQLDAQDVENTCVNFVVNGETIVVPAANAQKNDAGLYVFTAEMAAAQMMDSIEMALVVNGETLHADTYTIYMYVEYILGSGDFDAATKALVKEMLNYGAAAQNYFNYNTENLPAVPEGVGAQEVPTTGLTMAVEGSVSGIELYGATMLFRNKTAVRFYFTVSGQIEDYTIVYNGVEQTAVAKDGYWYVEIANINPQDLDQDITVTVTYGGETMTVTYGPMNYMVRMSQKGSDSLKALLKAMYNYYLAAETYVA